MNVRTICLAILHDGKATGYEIRKLSVEGEFAYFVDASYGSIYPALAKLEADGLVTSHVEPQDGKPAKKVYAITSAGRRAFIQSLYEPLEKDEFRSQFLLFARYASELPASLVEERLCGRLASLKRGLDKMSEIAECEDRAEDKWIIGYGISCLTAAHTYLQTHMNELVALARQDEATSEAAE